jgi:hypothetical protein
MQGHALRKRFTLFSFLTFLSLSCTPVVSSAAPVDPVWTQWISALKTQGFAVTQGIAAVRGCATYISVFGNCLNSNPSGGYYDILPPVDDSYVNPCYNAAHDCTGATPNAFTVPAILPDGSQANVNLFYQLGTSDALVVIVNLPPNAAYLGYQSYVFTRPRSAYSVIPCASIPTFPDPCRTPVMGSIGNSINHVTLNNQAGISLSTGGSVAFVTTPNQALFNNLSTVFQTVGGSASRLFAEPLAQKIVAGSYTATVNPGLDSTADEMNTLVRYTLPQVQADADAWQSDLTSNIQVFRVRNTSVATTRYAKTSLAAKHYTADETPYKMAVDELSADLKQWLQTQTTATVKVTNMTSSLAIAKTTGLPVPTSGTDLLGPYCLVKGTNCMRDTQDTDSYRVTVLPTSLKHTAIVVGVDSTQTGNGSYIGVGVTDYSLLEGVTSLAQTNPQVIGFASGSLTGSASDLVATLSATGQIPAPSPTLAAALPNLFVALATRNCPAGATAPICAKQYTMNVDATALPTSHAVQLTRRTYVHPGDTNGPNPDFILPTRVIY